MERTYEEFLESKRMAAVSCGFDVEREKLNPYLFDFQRDIVVWSLKKGRSAVFADCGLGKSIIQLSWAEQITYHTMKPVLILCPLSVAEQTKREADKFGIGLVDVVRDQSEVRSAGIYVTNYEMLEHFNASVFGGVVLDESAILRNFNGKTRNLITEMFERTPYKLSCTATPAPNDFMELGNQAEFLGVMTRTEMLATYFIHDGGETSKWRLKGHAQDKFWEWMATWAVVMTNPTDLGYNGDDYVLPDLNTYQHTVKYDENLIGDNYSLFAGIAQTLNDRRGARRDSLEDRCKLAVDIIKENPEEQYVVWCGLNREHDELERQLGDLAFSIRGETPNDLKVEYERRWREGERPVLITKPKCCGYGLNWQHCHNEIFVGLSDSWEEVYQATRRCWRFGQEYPVDVHIITSEAEGAVKDNIDRKEKQAALMTKEMVAHTKEILEEEIRGTVRISIPYNPKMDMELPEWLISA